MRANKARQVEALSRHRRRCKAAGYGVNQLDGSGFVFKTCTNSVQVDGSGVGGFEGGKHRACPVDMHALAVVSMWFESKLRFSRA